ncbi:unnamed protein product, partial [Anisakis simplex]|uniref:BORCS6 domain-containing protein n=1 Tax=Anisakis simplex TaxID=6269 RepID=A0A0M3JPM2_ANISI
MSSDQAQTDCDDIPSAVTNQTDKPMVKKRSRNMPLHIITSIPSKPSSNSAVEDPKSIPSTSQMASAATYDAATQHTFVVSDLERRIRDSARLNSSTSTPVSESSNCSNSLTGSSLTLTPDPLIISSLESSARTIAANLDVLLRDLRGSLHGMSDLTVEASECYAD